MARFAVLSILSLFALAAGQKACTGAECADEEEAAMNLLQTKYAIEENIAGKGSGYGNDNGVLESGHAQQQIKDDAEYCKHVLSSLANGDASSVSESDVNDALDSCGPVEGDASDVSKAFYDCVNDNAGDFISETVAEVTKKGEADADHGTQDQIVHDVVAEKDRILGGADKAEKVKECALSVFKKLGVSEADIKKAGEDAQQSVQGGNH